MCPQREVPMQWELVTGGLLNQWAIRLKFVVICGNAVAKNWSDWRHGNCVRTLRGLHDDQRSAYRRLKFPKKSGQQRSGLLALSSNEHGECLRVEWHPPNAQKLLVISYTYSWFQVPRLQIVCAEWSDNNVR
jgi:hypothetical protein